MLENNDQAKDESHQDVLSKKNEVYTMTGTVLETSFELIQDNLKPSLHRVNTAAKANVVVFFKGRRMGSFVSYLYSFLPGLNKISIQYFSLDNINNCTIAQK